jgi:hypothetical protein
VKKQPLITRRLDMLRDAVGVLRELRGELGVHSTLAAQAQSQVETMIVLYQQHLEAQSALAVLRTSERKPMHRVTRTSRRKSFAPNDPLGMVRTLEAIAKPPIIECRRCGCPLGSNRDCPACYPAKRRCSCGPHDRCDICRDETTQGG